MHTNGATADAYLTQPVGVNTLNFGKHAIKDLSAYNNPDGINGILAYTAVPASDVNDFGSLSTPPLVGSTDGRTFMGRLSRRPMPACRSAMPSPRSRAPWRSSIS